MPLPASNVSRFTSLDVFRGMTVCFMIIVNTPGNEDMVYAPLKHAAWNGFTVTDLVYPSFLFAVGNSVSFVKEKWMSLKQSQVVYKIIKRSLIIFLLGYLLHWLPYVNDNGEYTFINFSNVRVLGVLQRIALAYGAACLMIYYFNTRTIIVMSIVLLPGYWLLLIAGGDLTLQGNIVRHFDLIVMGEEHMPVRQGVAFEAQGWLGTIPAIVNVIAGYLAGMFIRKKGNTYETLALLCIAGFLLYTIGCFWDLFLPINKKLWTGSFVCYTLGFDCLIMAVIIYIIEFRNKRSWTYFFEVFGRNPLFIYILAEIGEHARNNIYTGSGRSISHWIFNVTVPESMPYLGSLLLAIAFTLLCWLVGYALDKRRIYIKV
jgi:predicted acyltransferase